MIFSVVQLILLSTIFNYETPKYLKQNNRLDELNKVMAKLYSQEQVKNRIDSIQINSASTKAPSYRETFCHPRYAKATLIGCILSIM